MTVNAVGFYVAAAVLVIGSLACVVLPSARSTVIAGAIALLGGAAVLAVSGAYVVAVVELVFPALLAGLTWRQSRRQRGKLGEAVAAARSRAWWVAAVIVLAAAALLAGWLIAYSSELPAAGPGGDPLLSVLHWRQPVGAVVGLAVAILGVWLGVMLSTESADERAHDADVAERRRKQERIERRRTDREASKRRRGEQR